MSWKASTSSSGRLRGLAQHQPAAVAPAREVAALAVGLGAVGDLHQRTAAPRGANQARIARIEHRAEVVGVRDERVPVAALEQRVEHARADERRVEVAVAGRRPLELRVGRPRAGRQVVGEQLRHLALDEVEREVGARASA